MKVRFLPPLPSFAKASDGSAMFYTYILKSSKSQKYYVGWTTDLRNRLLQHNSSKVTSTKYGVPWRLVYYSAFDAEHKAKDFELYLKSGSGKAFAAKRLTYEALVEDDNEGMLPSEA